MIVDVGAHDSSLEQGALSKSMFVNWDMDFANQHDAALYMFEILSSSCEKLTQKYETTRNAYVFCIGLSDVPSQLAFHTGTRSFAHFIEGFGTKDAVTQSVEVSTLDTWAKHLPYTAPRAIDLLKIDAEGWEMRILQGGQAVLEQTRFCLFEYGQPQMAAGSLLSDFLDFFIEEMSWSVYKVEASGLNLVAGNAVGNQFSMTGNFLASRTMLTMDVQGF